MGGHRVPEELFFGNFFQLEFTPLLIAPFPAAMITFYGISGALLALAGLAVLVATVRAVGLGAVRRAVGEAWVSMALGRTIDGRHALALAWGLRREAHRLRHALGVVQHDPAQRAALQVTLKHFTGGELSMMLRRMHALVATGDNDRVRALSRHLDEYSARWAILRDSAERQRLDAAMAEIRQQMEMSRRTSRAWVGLIRNLEETGGALKALERDLALYGISHDSPLPDFRRRLDEISTHVQHVQEAHSELNAAD